MDFCNPVTRSVYTTGDYTLDLGRHTKNQFGLKYDVGILLGTYSSCSDTEPKPYSSGTQVRCRPPNYNPVQVTVYYTPPLYTKSVTPYEDPTYSIQLKNGDLVRLTLKQLNSLDILPPPPTQQPTDNKNVST